MPLYMDIHTLDEASPESLAHAHEADLAVQDRYGVKYLRYWLNQGAGKVFCLVEAPSPEAAAKVHQDAHGLMAEEIIEVQPSMVDLFLGEAQDSPTGAAVLRDGAEARLDSGFRTILFTDMADSTALTQRVGDDIAMAILRRHNDIIRIALREHGGREVKHTGDGIMAVFLSASPAVACAVDIQRAVARHNDGDPEHPFAIRVGASAGEPVEEGTDLFGASVQLAARTCGEAEPHQILVSNVVAELCIGKGFGFVDRGTTELKGFDRPVRLHEVPWS